MSKSVKDSIREMRDKANQVVPKYFKSGGFGKYLRPGDLKEGETILRIAPPHDPVNNPSPFLPSRYTYLEVELDIDELSVWNVKDIIEKKKLESAFGVKESKEVIEMDLSELLTKAKKILGESYKHLTTKRVFIASQHGKEGTIDLVESYIQWCVDKINDEIDDKKEKDKKLAPIFGARIQGKWQPGINPSTNFVCYGWDLSDDKKPLYKIEIYGGMMNRIIELYDKFDSGDQVITIDPFSDPKEGIGLMFTKQKKESKWEYKIEDVPYLPQKWATYPDFVKQFALTDEMKKELADTAPLVDHFGDNVFKARDFKMQLNGLILFDSKHGFGAFQNDEFIEKVEQIANQFSEEEEEEKKAEEVRNGSDIDANFAKAEALKRQKVEEEEARKKAEEEEARKKAEEAKKVEENSVSSTNTNINPPSAMAERLAKMRKNINK